MEGVEYEGGVQGRYMAAGIAAAFLIVVLIAIVWYMRKKSTTKPPAFVQPARPTTLTDCGYPGMPRGWYDIKGVGYKNDFCRYGGDAASPIWFCKIFNGTDETHTYDPNKPFDPYTGNLTGWHCP